MTSHCKSFFLLCSNKNPCVIIKKSSCLNMNIALSVFRRSTVLFAGRRGGQAGRGGAGGGQGSSPPFNYNSMSWASSSEKSDMELSEEEFPPPSSCSLRASSVAYRWMYSEKDATVESQSLTSWCHIRSTGTSSRSHGHSPGVSQVPITQQQDFIAIEFREEKSPDDVILSF